MALAALSRGVPEIKGAIAQEGALAPMVGLLGDIYDDQVTRSLRTCVTPDLTGHPACHDPNDLPMMARRIPRPRWRSARSSELTVTTRRRWPMWVGCGLSSLCSLVMAAWKQRKQAPRRSGR